MTKFIKLSILLGVLLISFTHAQAHDPGSSKTTITITPQQIHVSQSYNTADITAIEQHLQLISNLIPLSISASSVSNPSKTETVFYTTYEYDQRSPVTASFKLLPLLARGHRMFVTMQDASGTLLSQHILDRKNTQVLIENSQQAKTSVIAQFFIEGIWHIWIGTDHILFLLTLLLPAVLVRRNNSWAARQRITEGAADVLRIVTAFTIAHSITLTLAIFNIVTLPGNVVETVIAISVVIAAMNNLLPVFKKTRWVMAFVFGLIHGFGFASVLTNLNLPDDNLITALLSFNLGVEAGQLGIILIVFPIIALLRYQPFYQRWILQGGSIAAAVIAVNWGLERSGLIQPLI